jgi:two-component system NtrC family sensor kinase
VLGVTSPASSVTAKLVSEEAAPIDRAVRHIGMIVVAYVFAYAAIAWPDRAAISTILGLSAFRIAFNIVGARTLHPRSGLRAAFLFAVVNAAVSLGCAHVVHWHLMALMELPFQMVTVDSFGPPRRARRFAVAILAVNAIVAVADGVLPTTMAVATVSALFVFVVTGEFGGMLRSALAVLERNHGELVEAHANLEAMHTKLLTQDRMATLGMIAASIAHEVNNPMSYVTSNVEALIGDLAAMPQVPPDLTEYVDDILPSTLDGIRRVNHIVADLRRFARGESAAATDVHINLEVAAAVRLAAGHLRREDRLTLDLDPDPGVIVGQPQQVGQVVLNLLINAAQATENGGAILVSTRREGDQVTLVVDDGGVGMSPEVQARIFEPFFTTKARGQGTGLGLAAVRVIVTKHGGTVDVTSTPGRGTTFTVRLPAAREVDRWAEARPVATAAAR